MSKYEYDYSESIQTATRNAQAYFSRYGCRWAHMREKNGRHRVPTKNEIKAEYLEMVRVAREYKSPVCESGELSVELVPLRYGYKPIKGSEGAG